MCYKGKCLYCLEVETGSLIYAILNVFFSAVGSVGSIGALIYTNFMYREAVHRADEANNEELLQGALIMGLAANVIIPIFIVIFLINFSFTVVLIVGICKRNASYVKSFFIFGVVKVVMSVIAVIIMMIATFMGPELLVVLFANAIYILILVMIRMTYKKFENEVAYNSFPSTVSVVTKY